MAHAPDHHFNRSGGGNEMTARRQGFDEGEELYFLRNTYDSGPHPVDFGGTENWEDAERSSSTPMSSATIISRRRMTDNVRDWLIDQHLRDPHITDITVAELLYDIALTLESPEKNPQKELAQGDRIRLLRRFPASHIPIRQRPPHTR